MLKDLLSALGAAVGAAMSAASAVMTVRRNIVSVLLTQWKLSISSTDFSCRCGSPAGPDRRFRLA
jgi:hypothetical protein